MCEVPGAAQGSGERAGGHTRESLSNCELQFHCLLLPHREQRLQEGVAVGGVTLEHAHPPQSNCTQFSDL